MWYFEPVWKFREKGMGGQPAGGETPATPAPAAPVATPAPAGSGQPKKPAAEWKTGTTHDRAYSHTWHKSPTSEHAMHVWHTHGDGADDLTVDINQPPTPEQKKLGIAHHAITLHHDRANGEAWVVSGEPWKLPHEGVQVAEPSPELQTLIQNHHYDHAWMPLLDKMAEEYPEHFDTPVQDHTTARNHTPQPRATKPARRATTKAPSPAQPPRPTA